MEGASDYRPRRSCLYMPGANARALEKARTLPADVLILDLEDAVAPDAKAEARALVRNAVSEEAYGPREVIIRVNGLDTEWGLADLAMAAAAGPDGVLVPKVTSAEEILAIDQTLSNSSASPELGLWVMIEMPLAVLNIREIAAASTNSRLTGFVMGTNDLAKECNAVFTADRGAFHTSLSLTVLAARAYGLAAIDGVYNDIQDEAGLRAECEQARVMGFDGKSVIHPAQLEVANTVFSPDAEAVAQARAVIEAFADPVNAGKGVLKVNGKMTELLHLEQAKQLVAVDEAIRDRN